MAVMLDVKNINVYYGAIHALKDISFQVNEGPPGTKPEKAKEGNPHATHDFR